jgi:DNA-directed RNA polymerase subunit M/transcription elongation factor TFIIS
MAIVSEIIMKAVAIKIVNRGGGTMFRLVKDKVKSVEPSDDATKQVDAEIEQAEAQIRQVQLDSGKTAPSERMLHTYAKTDTGSDYVIFRCPSCGRRNNQCAYDMLNYKPANEDVIPFKCKVCRRTVEVSRPPAEIGNQSLIMAPDEFTRQMADRRQALARRQPVP